MQFQYHYRDARHTIQLDANPDGTYAATIGERTYSVEVQRAGEGQLTLLIDGQRVHAYTATHQSAQTGELHHHIALVDREVSAYRLTRATGATGAPARQRSTIAGGSLTAQMPGQVLQVLVAEGDAVVAGQPLMLLEAMKMEMQVAAPHDGTVASLNVQPGDTVQRGQQLAEIVSSATEHGEQNQ